MTVRDKWRERLRASDHYRLWGHVDVWVLDEAARTKETQLHTSLTRFRKTLKVLIWLLVPKQQQHCCCLLQEIVLNALML